MGQRRVLQGERRVLRGQRRVSGDPASRKYVVVGHHAKYFEKFENHRSTYSFVLNSRGVELAGGGYLLFNYWIFIKWRGGNKMTYWENRNNPEGGRRVDDPTRRC